MRRNATQVKRWTTIILTAACMLGATLMAYAKDPTGPALEALTEQETDGPAAPQEEEIQAQEPPQPQEAPDEAASQGQETQPEENRADGLVLSGIVVSVSVTALMLSLTIRLYRRYGSLDLDEIVFQWRKEGE